MATMDPKDLRQLEGYLAKHFPSVARAGIEYATQSDDFLVLQAPLAKNHNDQDSAFGGSLYNLALMSCWVTLYLECIKSVENPRLVTRDAQMRYRHPASSPILKASCRKPNPRQWDGFFAHYQKAGRSSITLTSQIRNETDVVAYFDGVFVLLGDN
ncbi:MAG: thioesterase domain-containing protein [Pseudomonadales bacterium]|nr:thioesterase domain-containing protein [Pseudomonadales bacterium]